MNILDVATQPTGAIKERFNNQRRYNALQSLGDMLIAYGAPTRVGENNLNAFMQISEAANKRNTDLVNQEQQYMQTASMLPFVDQYGSQLGLKPEQIAMIKKDPLTYSNLIQNVANVGFQSAQKKMQSQSQMENDAKAAIAMMTILPEFNKNQESLKAQIANIQNNPAIGQAALPYLTKKVETFNQLSGVTVFGANKDGVFGIRNGKVEIITQPSDVKPQYKSVGSKLFIIDPTQTYTADNPPPSIEVTSEKMANAMRLGIMQQDSDGSFSVVPGKEDDASRYFGSGINIQMSTTMKEEGAFATGQGTEASKRINKFYQDATTNTGTEIDIMLSALDALEQAGDDTGAFTTIKLGASKAFKGIGLEDFGNMIMNNTSAAELIDMFSKRSALLQRSPQSGAGMPGSMSDSDREFLVRTVAGLDDESIRAKLMAMQIMQQRGKQEAVHMANWASNLENQGVRPTGGMIFRELQKFQKERGDVFFKNLISLNESDIDQSTGEFDLENSHSEIYAKIKEGQYFMVTIPKLDGSGGYVTEIFQKPFTRN